MDDNALYDPIQVEKIHLNDFSKTNNIDLTHNESVKRNRFVWDREKQTLLSPSRPTNGFWSKHLSNMMQQDFTLEEFFDHQELIVNRRNTLLNNS